MRGDAVVAGGSAPVSGRRPARVDVSDADVESLWASKRESLVAARRSRELAAVEARLARLAESAESASARGDARLKTLLRDLKLAERDEAEETAAATRAARDRSRETSRDAPDSPPPRSRPRPFGGDVYADSDDDSSSSDDSSSDASPSTSLARLVSDASLAEGLSRSRAAAVHAALGSARA